MLKLLFWPAMLVILYVKNTGQVMPIQADACVVVNLNREYQTIHSFGASDCWSPKFIGTWENDVQKDQMPTCYSASIRCPTVSPKALA